MAIDQDGLSLIWDRMRAYVAAHIGSPTASVPVATATRVGVVRPDSTTITIDEDGTIHSTYQYTLPTASESVLGGVKIDGVTIACDDNGVISAVGTNGNKPYWDVRTDSGGRRRLAIVIPEG